MVRADVFAPKIEYKLVAERSEANPSSLQLLLCGAREGLEPSILTECDFKSHVYANSTTRA